MISIHAGHNPDGLIASGAAGYMKESVENRKIVNCMMQRIVHGMEDVTVNNGTSQNDILKKLCDNMNSGGYDFNISIHLNAGGGNGVECWTYGANSDADSIGEDICENISNLGFKNRGVKHSKTLYILKHTVKPTIIVEVCFVDTQTDFEQYNKVGADKIAIAVLDALNSFVIYDSSNTVGDDEVDPVNEQESATGDGLERVQVGAYSVHKNAVNMVEKLKAAGFDAFIVK